VTVLASLLLAWSLAAQGPADYEKMRVLSESVLGKRPATEAEIQELLAQALKDSNPRIRREAVGILGTILTFSQLPQRPSATEWTARLRSVGEALQPELARATADADSQVRREALRNVVGVILYSKPGAPLPLATLRMLDAHYEKYSDTGEREFIVGALVSSYQKANPEARSLAVSLLTKALQGRDAYVIQAAGHAAAKAAAPELLPLLVAQLKNSSHIARMGVAQGIASYGAAARAYLPELEAALAAETHDITKKTIAGAISVITR
jgi:HEAT repeat protein